MDLVAVYAGSRSVKPPVMSPGSVRLTPAQEPAVRLQTETVRVTPGTHGVHTVGRVTPDEALTYRVSAGVDGWVRRVFSDRTGTQVKRGEAFFSRDISAPQQAYVYALESYERLKRTPSSPDEPLALATQQLATARDNLRFLGMGRGADRGTRPDPTWKCSTSISTRPPRAGSWSATWRWASGS
jgi:multidrug efflux pump subunit AcrA (membrane-fusion protein)